jgi:glycine/D-amino acid oxidase-like deaminating enzyme
MTQTCDVLVVGGGIVGSAVAFGLAQCGRSVIVLDEGDVAFRTSRGSFGLVWAQSKGADVPEYHRWSRESADDWIDFARELKELSGVDTGHRRPGGVSIALDEKEWLARRAHCEKIRSQAGDLGFEYSMLDRKEMAELVSGLGETVVGGCYTRYDGDANPLALLRALHGAMRAAGVRYVPGARATFAHIAPHAFTLEAGGETYAAPKVVLAAGVGNKALGRSVGLDVEVRPQRGQIVVTERVRSLWTMPTWLVRQTPEGGIIIGDSREEVGFDEGTTAGVMQAIARRAMLSFPFLGQLRIVRAWGALRVMSPDGLPIYDQSREFPGAFAVTCHSGVTLAAAHARRLAPQIARGAIEGLQRFSTDRFHVEAALA